MSKTNTHMYGETETENERAYAQSVNSWGMRMCIVLFLKCSCRFEILQTKMFLKTRSAAPLSGPQFPLCKVERGSNCLSSDLPRVDDQICISREWKAPQR